MNKETKPSREEVLRVAKECGAISKDGFDNVMQGNYVIERFAAAMYAKGAEDMRERCRNLALIEAHLQHDLDVTRNPRNSILHSPDSAKWQKMASMIGALPITPTNTEGEQG